MRREPGNVPATTTHDTYVELWWLPLGAGGRLVRWNGRVYERLRAARRRETPRDLFHSALELSDGRTRYVIEMAPVWSERTRSRGVQVEGPVGSRRLGISPAFRYEVRCWPDGLIPDADEAVDSPVRITDELARVEAILSLVARCPAYTWGRDELHCGDMWNSNSLVAWLLASTGDGVDGVHPPSGGRAPGWQAGLALAANELTARRGAG
jgi:hypothetical protein